MNDRAHELAERLESTFGERIASAAVALGEVTIEVKAADYVAVMRELRERPEFKFELFIDLAGVDYSTHATWETEGRGRYAVVIHLMSIANNQRVRVRTYAPSDEFPVLPSLVDVWAGVNWYEREAFDLYGIHFDGHPDLRRILTDYGFVGHPFRKDFPVSGYVEMHYDAELKRVVYAPVTIEPREVTPRIVREENYGKGGRS